MFEFMRFQILADGMILAIFLVLPHFFGGGARGASAN
jgi:hypothetical protein